MGSYPELLNQIHNFTFYFANIHLRNILRPGLEIIPSLEAYWTKFCVNFTDPNICYDRLTLLENDRQVNCVFI
jgi:hypothetical protein